MSFSVGTDTDTDSEEIFLSKCNEDVIQDVESIADLEEIDMDDVYEEFKIFLHKKLKIHDSSFNKTEIIQSAEFIVDSWKVSLWFEYYYLNNIINFDRSAPNTFLEDVTSKCLIHGLGISQRKVIWLTAEFLKTKALKLSINKGGRDAIVDVDDDDDEDVVKGQHPMNITIENGSLIQKLQNENAALKRKVVKMENFMGKYYHEIGNMHEKNRQLNLVISNLKRENSEKSTQTYGTKKINLHDPRGSQSFTMDLKWDNLLPVAELHEKVGPVSYLKYAIGEGQQCIFPSSPNGHFYPPADGWGHRIYHVIVPPNIDSSTSNNQNSTLPLVRCRAPQVIPYINQTVYSYQQPPPPTIPFA